MRILVVLVNLLCPVANAVQPVEHANGARWLDLPVEQRQRLTLGAVDAFRTEGSAGVRALAAQMLARIRLVEPSRLLALPDAASPPSPRELARLVDETGDTPVGHIALAAYATFWLVEPDEFPWIEPGHARAAAIAGHLLAAIRESGPPAAQQVDEIRAVARARMNAGSSFTAKMTGVELVEIVGATPEDTKALVEVLTSRSPDHIELPRLVGLLAELPLGDPARRRLREWLDQASVSSDALWVPLLALAERVGVRPDEVPFVAGLLDSPVAATREAAGRVLASVQLDDEARDAVRDRARTLLASRDWSEQGEGIRTLAWLGPTLADHALLVDFLWRGAHAINVAPAWDVVESTELMRDERAAIERWARETLDALDVRRWFNEDTDRRLVRRAVYAAHRLGIVEGAVAADVAQLLFLADRAAVDSAVQALDARIEPAQEAAIRARITAELTGTDRFWPAARLLEWLGPRPADLPVLFETRLRRDASGYGRSAVQGALSSLEPGSALEEAYREILREALRSTDPERRRHAASELARIGPMDGDVTLVLDDLLGEEARPDYALVRRLTEAELTLDPAARARIGRALTSSRPNTRAMGLQLVAAYGARPEDLPHLVAALDEPQSPLRDAKSALIARAVSPWPFPASIRVVNDEHIDVIQMDQLGSDSRAVAWDYLDRVLVAVIAAVEPRPTPWLGGSSLLSLALRADGLSEPAFLLLLDQAGSQRIRPAIRLVLRLQATPGQRRLMAFLGSPDPLLMPWDTVGARSLAAELHALAGRIPPELVSLRSEALVRMVEAVDRHARWRAADLPDLRAYAQAAPRAYAGTVEREIERLESQGARSERLRQSAVWVVTTLGAHALLWVALALAYPRSPLVQAVFFWNPWVRRIFGLGYAFPLVLAVPALRANLVEPFARSLVADADLESFDRDRHFADERVRPLESEFEKGAPVPLAEAIPEIRDHVILEGASGLGKTEALRALVASAPRHVAFLPARRIAEAGGPLEALARKLQGPARDFGFIRSLLHVNALDVVIDGLNEVDAQTRHGIVSFVEDQPRANIIIATQPIAWTPPRAGVTRRYELMPLDADQIEQFLISRRPRVAEDATDELDYPARCREFIADAIGPAVDHQSRRRALVTLSNPMDLTLAAELIALGASPTPGRLVEQQLAQLVAWFTRTHGRPFPVAEVAEHAFAQRLRDDNRIDLAADVVDALLRFRLAVPAPAASGGSDAGDAVDARFRHDRITEFFIARHLASRGDEETLRSIAGDPRFQGVVLELAATLPRPETEALFEIVSNDALQTGNHLFALTVARGVAARREAAD